LIYIQCGRISSSICGKDRRIGYRSIHPLHAECDVANPMDAPETNCSYSDTDESVGLHVLGGILRFGSNTDLRNYIESISANTPKGGAEVTAERLNDILIAGATAGADINYVISELQAARDYLQAEAERVRLANARYAHLAQTASASAKIIAESIGKWRSPERLSAPSLNPPNDAEVQPELNEG
jgi:hypothetical protein